ncbi:MAG: DUF559 domain-containing protein [Streptosporangiaceae bacterium]
MTAAELSAADCPRSRRRALVRAGELVPIWRGIYAVRGSVGLPDLPARNLPARGHATVNQAAPRRTVPDRYQRDLRLLRIAAVLTAAGPESVVSHEDAALVLGIDLLDRAPGDPLTAPVTLTRPPGAPGSRSGRAGVRLLTAALPAGHVTMRQGIRVTAGARTVADLARASPFASGVVAADSALRLGLASRAELRAVIADCARWPGIARARAVADFSDARSESAFESLARVVFRDGGLPPPDLQVWVGGDTAAGRVDFLWRRYRTVAEADGVAKYANPLLARAQLDRDARLRAAGFEVVHFGWRQLTLTPEQVVGAIRESFRRGGGRP